MNSLAASELILNPDGSIYHLNLLPEQLASTVILVGDPERVELITRHFDHVECVVRKREFHTQTGVYKNHRISVISTGIGTDNIDIVLNELDALINIDFKAREIKKELGVLDVIRIGTSGSLHADIPVDSFLISRRAVGFDSLLHYYESTQAEELDFSQALEEHLGKNPKKGRPYVVSCDESLAQKFGSSQVHWGVTGTNVGFYGPQGRVLRLPLEDRKLWDKITSFQFQEQRITNLEMETAGIYGLSKLLGHRAVSLNAIVANRATGTFSEDPATTIEGLIRYTLERLI